MASLATDSIPLARSAPLPPAAPDALPPRLVRVQTRATLPPARASWRQGWTTIAIAASYPRFTFVTPLPPALLLVLEAFQGDRRCRGGHPGRGDSGRGSRRGASVGHRGPLANSADAYLTMVARPAERDEGGAGRHDERSSARDQRPTGPLQPAAQRGRRGREGGGGPGRPRPPRRPRRPPPPSAAKASAAKADRD